MGATIIMYFILILLAAFAVIGMVIIGLIIFSRIDTPEDTETEEDNNKTSE